MREPKVDAEVLVVGVKGSICVLVLVVAEERGGSEHLDGVDHEIGGRGDEGTGCRDTRDCRVGSRGFL